MKTCDCCGKDCCKRVPVVLPDGSIADVGTSCAKKFKRAKRSDLFNSLYYVKKHKKKPLTPMLEQMYPLDVYGPKWLQEDIERVSQSNHFSFPKSRFSLHMLIAELNEDKDFALYRIWKCYPGQFRLIFGYDYAGLSSRELCAVECIGINDIPEILNQIKDIENLIKNIADLLAANISEHD